MWIESASNTYNIFFISTILPFHAIALIFYLHFIIFPLFVYDYCIFKVICTIPYMDLRPWIAILLKKKYSCDFIGPQEKSETAWDSAISLPF